jgi:hypothetical protein
MAINIFYVYIRLRHTIKSDIPPSIYQALCSNCGETKILSLSVCKEPELEKCLAEKAKFWKDNIVNVETKLNDADLVIHQIQTSNGGLELSHATIEAIAEGNLTLNITYTVCKLI